MTTELAQLSEFLRRMRQTLPLELRAWVDQQSRNLAADSSFGAVERFQLTQSLKRLAGTSPTMSQRVSTFGNTMIVLALGQAIEQRGGRGSTDLEQAFNTLVANLDPKLGRRAQMTGANQGAQAEYLELQYLIQGESRLLIVLANIMKAEHDLAMSIVQNLR